MMWGREIDEDEAAAHLVAFHDIGGTLVDTAASYGGGEAERILGRLLADVIPRDELVISAKAGITRRGDDRVVDGSRGGLLRQLDDSLRSLGTDWIDLWQVHAPDPLVPMAETLATLDYARESGKVRYVGLSNYPGWQLAGAASWQRAVAGRAPICASQVEYSLISRQVEESVLPAAQGFGVGVLAYSPLGGGVLTGKYRSGTPADSRGAGVDRFADRIRANLDQRKAGIIEAVATAADGLATSPLAVSVAWVRDAPGVTAVIVGARTLGQLSAVLATEDLDLPPEIRSALDDVSAP
jgi:aryl-alcohol dehydrogenase-like predicted oxidoreductase